MNIATHVKKFYDGLHCTTINRTSAVRSQISLGKNAEITEEQIVELSVIKEGQELTFGNIKYVGFDGSK